MNFEKGLNEIEWFIKQDEENLQQFIVKYTSVFLVSDKTESDVELKFGDYNDGILRIKSFAYRNLKMLDQIKNFPKSWGVFKVEFEAPSLFW